MKYINLEEYQDKPELIQHRDGTKVLAVIPVPGKEETAEHFTVVFERGTSRQFFRDGRYYEEAKGSSFRLIEKPKRKVRGYRKAILHSDGSISTGAMYLPSKEAFEKNYRFVTLVGDWEEIEYEVED